jgi:hypothetical protein
MGPWPGCRCLATYKQLGEDGDGDCIVPYLPGRRLFITKNGHVGYGAAAPTEQDNIFVLFGGSVPYILRKVRDGFHLIGEAYLYGFMEGEATTQWREGALVDRWVYSAMIPLTTIPQGNVQHRNGARRRSSSVHAMKLTKHEVAAAISTNCISADTVYPLPPTPGSAIYSVH